MRYLVLSDIHSNDAALEAALRRSEGAHDAVLVLGDLVGYGARPNEVIDRVRELPGLRVIRGNHDKAAAGIEEPEHFNPPAAEAIAWTRDALRPENLEWLRQLPQGPLTTDDGILISHGSPLDEDAYVFGEEDARLALERCSADVAFFGHTHLPVAFRVDERGAVEGRVVRGPNVLLLGPPGGTRWLINPGSVGQPRDGDPSAAHVVVDVEERRVAFVRSPYDVRRTQESIRQAGLPGVLADRLEGGG